jgi:hypothetical protein
MFLIGIHHESIADAMDDSSLTVSFRIPCFSMMLQYHSGAILFLITFAMRFKTFTDQPTDFIGMQCHQTNPVFRCNSWCLEIAQVVVPSDVFCRDSGLVERVDESNEMKRIL